MFVYRTILAATITLKSVANPQGGYDFLASVGGSFLSF
jgi:hypothetical protein